MPITFTCTCGKMLRVKDELAGRKVRCPECTAAVAVPQSAPAWEVVEDAPAPAIAAAPPPLPRAKAVPVQRFEIDDEDEERPRRRRRDEEDRDDDDRPRKRPRDDNEEDDDDRPRKKKFRTGKEDRKQASSFGMEKGIIESGVAGGALAMIGAVVWFVVGLMNDRLFWYPPVLFVVGMIAFIKGLMGHHKE